MLYDQFPELLKVICVTFERRMATLGDVPIFERCQNKLGVWTNTQVGVKEWGR